MSAKEDTIGTVRSDSPQGSDPEGNKMDDAARLDDMGYSNQNLKRNFSVWTLLAIGFSLTNSWFGVSAALVTGINSGGPVVIVYGIVIIAIISTCVGVSLSELASAMPNAGGQYFWAYELAPEKYKRFASYVTGWFAWAGSVFTSASVALGVAGAVMGCIQIYHPDLTIKPWMILVAYQAINALAFLFNCSGKFLPHIATLALWISLISFLTILLTVPISAPTHQSPHFVFLQFTNNTGWSSPTIAFILGLINTNWAFTCLDSATHLAEETSSPSTQIPIAIMGTVAIGFITSFTYAIAMFFSLSSLPLLISTPTGVPILELFNQALHSRAGAVLLECLIIATGFGCQIACHTWQSRLCWSFARDRGIPGSRYLAKIHPVMDVPFNAHLLSCILVAILGFLYLASSTAFHSMVTACIVLLYISYSIPVSCLLLRGRQTITHGPFWLPRLGFLSNIVVLGWTVFTGVMYSFPPEMPVSWGNMNYVFVVYILVTLLVVGYWFVEGRNTFRDGRDVREGVGSRENLVGGGDVGGVGGMGDEREREVE